jgi:hypothetical protein
LKEEIQLAQSWDKSPFTAAVAVTFEEKPTGRRHTLKAPVLPEFSSYFPRLCKWAEGHLGWRHVSGGSTLLLTAASRVTAASLQPRAEQACQLIDFLSGLERPPDEKVAREGRAGAGRLFKTNSAAAAQRHRSPVFAAPSAAPSAQAICDILGMGIDRLSRMFW